MNAVWWELLREEIFNKDEAKVQYKLSAADSSLCPTQHHALPPHHPHPLKKPYLFELYFKSQNLHVENEAVTTIWLFPL